MNEQSGVSLPNANLSPFGQRGGLPSTGLRDLMLPVAAVPAAQKTVSVGEIRRGIVKWWWLIAGIVVACVLAAFAISSMIQPVYRATTTIEVNCARIQQARRRGAPPPLGARVPLGHPARQPRKHVA